MTRAPSAYFLFAEAVRAQVQAELQAENPEAKISVATLGKAIGERWRALSDEQKQHYKTRAAEKAVEAGALFGSAEGMGLLLLATRLVVGLPLDTRAHRPISDAMSHA